MPWKSTVPVADETHIGPEDIPLDVVFEDDDLIVVEQAGGHGGASRAGHAERHAGQRAFASLRG